MTAAAPLAPVERAALLGIARGAVLAHLGVAPMPALPAEGRLATEERGVFVTLHADDRLRGCVGAFGGRGPLAQAVARLAVAAASQDPRFPPVTASEIAALRVSLSVLAPARPLEAPEALRAGVDGLLVTRGWHRGALLPKVAVEHGWDARTFLKHACLKAGLPADAWEDPETRVEAFEAEEFGE